MDEKTIEYRIERAYLQGKRDGIQLRNRGQIFAWGLIVGMAIGQSMVIAAILLL